MIHYIHDIMYIMIQTTDVIYYYIIIFIISIFYLYIYVLYIYIYIYIYICIICYFKESVRGEYHMYQFIPLHTCDYLQKTWFKINVANDEGKQPK